VQSGWQAVLQAWPVILSTSALLASLVAVVPYCAHFATKADVEAFEKRITASVKDSEGRIMASVKDSEGRIMASVKDSEGRIMASVKDSEGRTNEERVEGVQKSVESLQKSVDRLTINVIVVLVVCAFFVGPKYTK
jgi:gas vesicle protein